MSWRDFEDGRSLGRRGSEQGVIVLDEEHERGARITLEGGGGPAPFAITCGVYGWMVHTRFFAGEEEARSQFNAMKAALDDLLVREPAADSNDMSEMAAAVNAFVERYP